PRKQLRNHCCSASRRHPTRNVARYTARPRTSLREGVADAMTGPTYRVIVTREGGAWLAEVPDLAGGHTYARTLAALDKAVREVIVLAAYLPPTPIYILTIHYTYPT